MKVSRNVLNYGLNLVSRVVPTRAGLPIYTCVLFDASPDGLVLTGTDVERTIRCKLPADVDEGFTVAVGCRLLRDLVKAMTADDIDVNIEGKSMVLKSEHMRYTLDIMRAEDFPEFVMPEVEPVVAMLSDLAAAIKQVSFAASSEVSRPVLTGVHMVLDGERLELGAADGYRLSRTKIDAHGKPFDVIVPVGALRELAVLADVSEVVEIRLAPNRPQIVFDIGDIIIASQLLEGAYPDFDAIIPKEHKVSVKMDKGRFASAVRAASILSSRSEVSRILKSSYIDLEITGDGVIVKSGVSGVGSMVSQVPATVEGEAMSLSVAARFLQDALGAIEEDEVSIYLQEPLAPMLILGGEFPEQVVMPASR